MTLHRAFEFRFTANLHGQVGINISSAAQARLRPGEIDNERKDTIGRGQVNSLRIAIWRTNTQHEWMLSATTRDDGYDRGEAGRLREAVLAALEENAEDFKELPSDLHPA
jgi:hypothetical protein